MYTHFTSYFSPDYKTKVMDAIRELRMKFETEMIANPGLDFGVSFHDDEQCLHAFVMQFERGKIPSTDQELQLLAQIKEKLVYPDSDSFRYFCWKALRSAAETDYYRLHKKEYR